MIDQDRHNLTNGAVEDFYQNGQLVGADTRNSYD